MEKIGVKLGVGHVLNVRVGSADRGGLKGSVAIALNDSRHPLTLKSMIQLGDMSPIWSRDGPVVRWHNFGDSSAPFRRQFGTISVGIPPQPDTLRNQFAIHTGQDMSSEGWQGVGQGMTCASGCSGHIPSLAILALPELSFRHLF